MSVIMQARSSVSGELVTWTASSPDWSGAEFPGPGSPMDVALAAKSPGGNGGGGSPAGTANEVQYRGNDGEFAAIPGVEGSPNGLSIGGTKLHTAGGVAMQYDSSLDLLNIGADKTGANAHDFVGMQAATVVYFNTPAISHTAHTVRGQPGAKSANLSEDVEITTTNATPTVVTLLEADALPSGRLTDFTVRVVAIGGSSRVTWTGAGHLSNGGASLAGGTMTSTSYSYNWDSFAVTLSVSGGALIATVTGKAATSVSWRLAVEGWQVAP